MSDYKQLTIFDWMQDQVPTEEKTYDLETMEESEMVSIVESKVGLHFVYKDSLFGWQHVDKKKKVTYSLKFSRYNMIDCRDRFIDCSVDAHNEGAGCPCDSIDGAVKCMKKYLEKYQ